MRSASHASRRQHHGPGFSKSETPGPRGPDARMEFLPDEARPRTVYRIGVVLLVAAAACLPVDLWITREVTGDRLLGDVRKALALSEAFAHGFGAAVILLVACTLEPNRRRIARAAACTFGAGLLANCAKVMIGRTRPNFSQLEGTVWATFTGWAPGLSGEAGHAAKTAVQSFPSGHAATAVGLAVGLAYLYPRGRWIFVSLATLGALQRVAFGHHFLTDVLVGAALGCLVGASCTDPRGLGVWFDRLERHAAAVDLIPAGAYTGERLRPAERDPSA